MFSEVESHVISMNLIMPINVIDLNLSKLPFHFSGI